jgi:serine/threonine-protein kinase
MTEGRVLAGKYRLVREIARGGGGVVHEAESVLTGERVAIKVLRPDVALTEPVVRRLMREARTAARLVHPNVVTVIELGYDDDGMPYFAQELLRGSNLFEHLAKVSRMTLRDALAALLPVMDALALAHDVGLVHRDVKPSNIFLSRGADGIVVPKLIDFGAVSAVIGDTIGGLTAAGTVLGTAQYMSPEQIVGGHVDARTDQWSMAVVLYEAITGTLPFEAATVASISDRIRGMGPPPPSECAPGLPPELDAVVARAMSPDPATRFPDLRALSAALLDLPMADAPFTSASAMPAAAHLDVDTAVETTAPPLEPISTERRGAGLFPGRAAWRIGFFVATSEVEGYSLAEAFERALRARCAVFRYLTYAELVDGLLDDQIDLAWLPPAVYARARRARAARLLVTVERAGQRGYASALLARRAVSGISDLQGKRAVWTDSWSAAGYLMPRVVLRSKGVDPDGVFASQGFVGRYDAVMASLRSGSADVGATFCSVDARGAILRRPWNDTDDFRVLAVSEKIPGDAVCASYRVARDERERLRRLFTDDVGAASLLHSMGASKFARGSDEDYAVLARVLA